MIFKRKTRFQKMKEGALRKFDQVDKKQLLVYSMLIVATAIGVRKRLMS